MVPLDFPNVPIKGTGVGLGWPAVSSNQRQLQPERVDFMDTNGEALVKFWIHLPVVFSKIGRPYDWYLFFIKVELNYSIPIPSRISPQNILEYSTHMGLWFHEQTVHSKLQAFYSLAGKSHHPPFAN